MKQYKVIYSGNASRFRNFSSEVNANSEREAVEKVFQRVMDENYFPQEDGSIKDCDGNTIAEATDNIIEYDGGCFSAEEIEEIF
jgi:ribosomal protein L20A (L18A)